MSGQQQGLFRFHALQKLKNEARFAETWVGNQIGHAETVASALECRAHHGQFIVTTDKVAETPGERGVESRRPFSNEMELPKLLRFGDALDLALSVKAQVDNKFDEVSRRVAYQTASRWSQGLNA